MVQCPSLPGTDSHAFTQGARLREKQQRKDISDELSESSEDESDIEEELGYISPLDTVDAYVTFKQALTSMSISPFIKGRMLNLLVAFQMRDGNNYQRATTSLTPEQQMLLMDVMRIAEERSQSS